MTKLLTPDQLGPPSPHWWQRPFSIEGKHSQLNTHDIEVYLCKRFGKHLTEFYPRGVTLTGARAQRLPLNRALERAHSSSAPTYTFLPVPAARWAETLRLLGAVEPPVIANRGFRPEGECAAALAPANRTSQFENELRWRMLALAGGPGAGMHLHADTLPLATWHYQERVLSLCQPHGRMSSSRFPPALPAMRRCMARNGGYCAHLQHPKPTVMEQWMALPPTSHPAPPSVITHALRPSYFLARVSSIQRVGGIRLSPSVQGLCPSLEVCSRNPMQPHSPPRCKTIAQLHSRLPPPHIRCSVLLLSPVCGGSLMCTMSDESVHDPLL